MKFESLLQMRKNAEVAVKKAKKNLVDAKRFLEAVEKDIEKFKKEMVKE